MPTPDLWLCSECVQAAVNNDYSGLGHYLDEPAAALRMKEIQQGLDELGPDLVMGNNYSEFSWGPCDCCGENLGGSRTRFTILERIRLCVTQPP